MSCNHFQSVINKIWCVVKVLMIAAPRLLLLNVVHHYLLLRTVPVAWTHWSNIFIVCFIFIFTYVGTNYELPMPINNQKVCSTLKFYFWNFQSVLCFLIIFYSIPILWAIFDDWLRLDCCSIWKTQTRSIQNSDSQMELSERVLGHCCCRGWALNVCILVSWAQSPFKRWCSMIALHQWCEFYDWLRTKWIPVNDFLSRVTSLSHLGSDCCSSSIAEAQW